MFRVLLDPFEDLAITFASGQLFLQRFGINAQESQQALVERAIVMVFTAFAANFRATFIEHSWKRGITAESYPRAARGLLSQIGCLRSHNFYFYKTFTLLWTGCQPVPNVVPPAAPGCAGPQAGVRCNRSSGLQASTGTRVTDDRGWHRLALAAG